MYSNIYLQYNKYIKHNIPNLVLFARYVSQEYSHAKYARFIQLETELRFALYSLAKLIVAWCWNTHASGYVLQNNLK